MIARSMKDINDALPQIEFPVIMLSLAADETIPTAVIIRDMDAYLKNAQWMLSGHFVHERHVVITSMTGAEPFRAGPTLTPPSPHTIPVREALTIVIRQRDEVTGALNSLLTACGALDGIPPEDLKTGEQLLALAKRITRNTLQARGHMVFPEFTGKPS